MLRNILLFSILTFAIIVLALVSSVYHNFTTTTITPDIAIQITPIPSGFDMTTANAIQNRKAVPPGNLTDQYLKQLATQSATIVHPSVSPVASTSASRKITPTPSSASPTQPDKHANL